MGNSKSFLQDEREQHYSKDMDCMISCTFAYIKSEYKSHVMEFIDITRQYQAMKTEIDQTVLAVMNKAEFIMSSEVETLEKRLSAYLGVKHVICCGSGTDALPLIFQAHGIGTGDAVFCPDMTFIVSIEPSCLLWRSLYFVMCRIPRFKSVFPGWRG